ncbi:protein kinase family protein [Halobacteroides halobius DSM 5150]|uniref:Protein kinase family protein n=1 Tax=Halobacteroides halobius (strain ATCC 35273 / DSM 5150 / MD-1) TaxID=748449 RepID=L0KA35_HALHC|nr:protein kinase [Halobacteroides halobius]AGB41385.1 protein kinase family protein [Halobacteroides halobius DSM 5150]
MYQIKEEGKNYKHVVDEVGTSYYAQKLFTTKKPKGRVAKSILDDIKAIIKEDKSINHQQYLSYHDTMIIDGEYYLLRANIELIPLADYLQKERVAIKLANNWLKTILNIFANAKDDLWSGLLLESLMVGPNQKIFMLDPIIINKIIQYRSEISFSFDNIWLQPPEIIKNGSWSKESQLYSIIGFYYYLLTGQTFFQTDTKGELTVKIKHLSPIEPKLLNPQVSTELNNLVVKCLKKDKNKRPGSFKEVYQRLEKLEKENKLISSQEKIKERQEKQEQQKKLFSLKERSFWFLYRYWRVGIGMIAGIIILTVLLSTGGYQPILKRDTTPKKVVKYFYKSLNNKNINLLEEVSNAEKIDYLEEVVIRGRVIEKMKQAYGGSKRPGKDVIYSIEGLSIELISKQPVPKFKASYKFIFNRPQANQIEIPMEDYLILKRVNKKWKVVKIRGSITNQNFMVEARKNKAEGQ